MDASTGPKIVILYEDRDSDGLHRLIESMVSERRSAAGLPRARLISHPANGNTQLVRKCGDFQQLRFLGPHRADYVLAVIDVHNVEGAIGVTNWAWAKPEEAGRFRDQRQERGDAIRGILRNQAFAGLSTEVLGREEARFLPIPLFWEIESILLAGGATLERVRGLQFPPDLVSEAGVIATRAPKRIVEKAWRARPGARGAYDAKTDGSTLFDDLREERGCWPTLLDRVPSLHEIVGTLASL